MHKKQYSGVLSEKNGRFKPKNMHRNIREIAENKNTMAHIHSKNF